MLEDRVRTDIRDDHAQHSAQGRATPARRSSNNPEKIEELFAEARLFDNAKRAIAGIKELNIAEIGITDADRSPEKIFQEPGAVQSRETIFTREVPRSAEVAMTEAGRTDLHSVILPSSPANRTITFPGYMPLIQVQLPQGF